MSIPEKIEIKLLSHLRRPKPKNTGAAERMSAAYDKKVDDTMNS